MNPLLNEEIEISIAGIRQFQDFVNKKYNFDLNRYALTSFKRRLVRFIEKNDLRNLDILIKRLEKDEALFQSFLTSLSVDVTELLRDPALWRYFRDEILPAVSKNHDSIKIWIPGCSSGDEVVSTAIILKEANMLDKAEIIASDITDEIGKKIIGRVYPISKHELSEANYKRYNPESEGDFSKYVIDERSGFKVPEELFKNLKYIKYNYTEDFKIRGINVIICRNNFIYYTAQFQERLLEIISSKLAFNGYLMIGNKENIAWSKDMARFTLVNESEKVFRKTSP